MYFSVFQVRASAVVLVLYECTVPFLINKISIKSKLYLHIQERMLQQSLTVFTFWPGHWMQGLVFWIFAHHLDEYIFVLFFCFSLNLFFFYLIRTVMKSGPEIVKAGLRSFFESAADDIEKMVENLKLGKVSKGNQVREKHNNNIGH